jgi:hypothetical protein
VRPINPAFAAEVAALCGKPNAQVDGQDVVEVAEREIREGRLSRHPGVVDEDVDAPEAIERRADDCRATFRGRDGVGVGNRSASTLGDLGRDRSRRLRGCAASVGSGAGVVHDDLRSSRCEQQRVFPPEARASTGDDRDAPLEA